MAIDKIQSTNTNHAKNAINSNLEPLSSVQKSYGINDKGITSSSDMSELIQATKELVHHLRN